MLTISTESPTSPDGRALIAGSQLALLQAFPPEDIFTLDPEELAIPSIRFYVARDAGVALGCVALMACDGYGEVKRLFVTDAGRGKGIARALMAALEADARRSGLPWVRLETGNPLVAAVALYRALGYRVCGPFGDYPEHPASLFMEKPLIPETPAQEPLT